MAFKELKYVVASFSLFLCVRTSRSLISDNKLQGVLLCLREGASTTDIIMGLLQVQYYIKISNKCTMFMCFAYFEFRLWFLWCRHATSVSSYHAEQTPTGLN